jgi:hypothetical protein
MSWARAAGAKIINSAPANSATFVANFVRVPKVPNTVFMSSPVSSPLTQSLPTRKQNSSATAS